MKQVYSAMKAKEYISEYLKENEICAKADIFAYLQTKFNDVKETHMTGCLRQLVVSGQAEIVRRGEYISATGHTGKFSSFSENVANYIDICISDIKSCMTRNLLEFDVNDIDEINNIKDIVSRLESIVEELLPTEDIQEEMEYEEQENDFNITM